MNNLIRKIFKRIFILFKSFQSQNIFHDVKNLKFCKNFRKKTKIDAHFASFILFFRIIYCKHFCKMTEETTGKSINDLPDEVLLQIFENLDGKTLKICTLISNR